MDEPVTIKDDTSSNKVICVGLKEFVRTQRVSVAKLHTVSGISRNTIKKMINEEPVRKDKAEELLLSMRMSGMLDDTSTPEVEDAKSKRPLPDSITGRLNGVGPEAEIQLIRTDLQALSARYQQLLGFLEENQNQQFDHQLQFLKADWGSVESYHKVLMAIADLDD